MRGILTHLYILAFCVGLPLLTSCNKELVDRIDRLEAELRAVRSDTRESVDEVKTRVAAAESMMGEAKAGKSLSQRVQALEDSFSDVVAMKSRDNEMVYLRANLKGHAPLLTDHGTFLVRIEGIDLNTKTQGFSVHLNIGNPQAISIQQFYLKGSYGGGTPELPEGEDYTLRNEKIKEWETTLKPFEAHIRKAIEPFSWTSFSVDIPATVREEIEMIRFSMTVENAQLAPTPAKEVQESGVSFAHIDVDSQAASVIKTEYGAFLITVKSAEQSDVGTKLNIEIGNPYGFSLNQCRLLGEYGQATPRRAESASDEEYAEKMSSWSASLQPFESLISTKVANFRWSRATILIPGKVDEVKFLRCQLRIEDVSLPAATEEGKPPGKLLGK